jgi:hypothetical protein
MPWQRAKHIRASPTCLQARRASLTMRKVPLIHSEPERKDVGHVHSIHRVRRSNGARVRQPTPLYAFTLWGLQRVNVPQYLGCRRKFRCSSVLKLSLRVRNALGTRSLPQGRSIYRNTLTVCFDTILSYLH